MTTLTDPLEAIQARADAATEARKQYNVLEIREPVVLSKLHKSQKDVMPLLDLARKQREAIEAVKAMTVRLAGSTHHADRGIAADLRYALEALS